MSKNIVLCSDGTGNSGGKGQGTNVWRIYQAVDRHRSTPGEGQIAFYDDGVGTEDNKFLRLIGGATGWGFTRNVKDLYKFLAKNYVAGEDEESSDCIYMFGFSRGAYTVRALAAFVLHCGIITNARDMSEADLDQNLDDLIFAFVARPHPDASAWDKMLRNFVASVFITRKQISRTISRIFGKSAPVPPAVDRDVRIKCIGVWDTVSAVGVPFDIAMKRLVNAFFKFDFRDQDLSKKVEHGFHALAIDDERKSFHPVTWNHRDNVKQVWFAGVHSNVGGGYPKQGMAYVALDWMMKKVEHDPSDPSKNGSAPGNTKWGLYFNRGLRDAARHYANVHDKLYDSRAGFAAYYRYEPRDIAELSAGKPAKIHHSVLSRIRGRTLGYSPGSIPAANNVQIVEENGTTHDIDCLPDSSTLNPARKWIAARKVLQLVFFLLSLVIAAAIAKFVWGESRVLRYVIDGALFLAFVAVLTDARNWIKDETAAKITRLAAGSAFAIFLLFEGAHFGMDGKTAEVSAFVQPLAEFLVRASGVAHPDALIGFIVAYPELTILVVGLLVVVWLSAMYFRAKLAAIFELACDTLRSTPSAAAPAD